MKSSENLNELFKAMAEFRAKVNQPAKNAQNPFFKSSYVQLEGVQNAIDEAIKGTGLSYVQLTHNTENGVAVETVIMHSSGQWLSTGGLALNPVKKDPQGYGSAISYQRRYQLAAAFGITSDLDDDANAATFGTSKPQSNNFRYKQPKQVSKLDELKQDYTFLLARAAEATKRTTKDIQDEIVAGAKGSNEERYEYMNNQLKAMLKNSNQTDQQDLI